MNRKPTKRSSLIPVYAAVIVLAGVAAYSNTFRSPFHFDDYYNITISSAIHSLANFSDIMAPPPGAAVGGRPVANLSFALNWAMSSADTWSYHIFNLAIHILAGLCLLGIVRRTLTGERLQPVFGERATGLAFVIALIWTVHPIHTEAVTYISQRFESLMGLFFFLTLYCAIRGWQSLHARPWHLGAIFFCLLGVGTKEVIVAAPVMIYLYDILFVEDGSKGVHTRALRRWSLLYSGLLLCIAGLFLLVTCGATVDATPIPEWGRFSYLMTQTRAIFQYISLVLWPVDLCFDYDWPMIPFKEAWPYGVIVVSLLTGTVWAVIKKKPVGFLGAWFFVILAPTSSFMPLPFVIWERRAYLSSAAIVALIVLGGYSLLVRLFRGKVQHERIAREICLCLVAIAVLLLMGGAMVRNMDYASGMALWTKTVKQRPKNARAQHNLGLYLAIKGESDLAIARYEQALRLQPDFSRAHLNLGEVLVAQGKQKQAIEHFEKAVALEPELARPYIRLGAELLKAGHTQKAMEQFKLALIVLPKSAMAHNNLGIAYLIEGNPAQALGHFKKAISIWPDYTQAQYHYGLALLFSGKPLMAKIPFTRVLGQAPEFAKARWGLADTELILGNKDEAERIYGDFFPHDPAKVKAHKKMVNTLATHKPGKNQLAGLAKTYCLAPDYTLDAKPE